MLIYATRVGTSNRQCYRKVLRILYSRKVKHAYILSRGGGNTVTGMLVGQVALSVKTCNEVGIFNYLTCAPKLTHTKNKYQKMFWK